MLKKVAALFDHSLARTIVATGFAVGTVALVAYAQQQGQQQVLPGQPGADTTVAAVEARSAPYSVTGVSPQGVVTQKEVTPPMANALMKNAQPVSGEVMVLIHGNTAYIVHDVPMRDGQSFETAIRKPMQ
jgi:hypothetical protein